MYAMTTEYHLTAKQVIVRILSVLVCGVGAAACVYSLSLQVEEVGTMMASMTWFSGLGAVVLALAGYAVTCDPGKGKSRVPLAACCIVVLAAVFAVLALTYLYDMLVVNIALCAAAVQAIVLVVYHFILKSEDSDAI